MARYGWSALIWACMLEGYIATNISNHAVTVVWSDDCTLQYFGRPSGNNTLKSGAEMFWSLDLVTAASPGITTVSSSNATCTGVDRSGSDRVVTRHEVVVPVVPFTTVVIEVTITTSLAADESDSGAGLVSSAMRVRVTQGDPTRVSLWEVSAGLTGVRVESQAARQFLPKVMHSHAKCATNHSSCTLSSRGSA